MRNLTVLLVLALTVSLTACGASGKDVPAKVKTAFSQMFPNAQKIDKIIWSPAKLKLSGHNGYKFMTGNLMWYFFVTSHLPNVEIQSFFVQESGMLRVWLDFVGEDEVYANMVRALRSRRVE